MAERQTTPVYRLGELLTIPQLAAALSVAEKTVRDWIYRRTISCTKLGGRIYFSKAVVEGLLNAHRREASGVRPCGSSNPRGSGKGGTSCREDKRK